jgi:hypothetical protein
MNSDLDMSDALSVGSLESDAGDRPSAVLERTPLINGLVEEDEPMQDEEFLQEDAKADSWLAQFPGGGRLLYPRLFVVGPAGIDIISPAREIYEPRRFMTLPQEIRALVYRRYFDTCEEDDRHAGGQFNVFPEKEEHPEEQHHAFPETHEDGLCRLNLTSEDTELKHLLSQPLLRACRQLRFEALPVLLGSRIFTAEWFPAIPRFIEFLGERGRAMVRYMDMWDFHDMKSDLSYSDRRIHLAILSSIQCLPLLRHLRIVLPYYDAFPHFEKADFEARRELGHRARQELRHGARPKIRVENAQSQSREVLDVDNPSASHDPHLWPEYALLLGFSTDNFTLAFDFPEQIEPCVEFDQTTGLYPELLRAMRGNRAQNSAKQNTLLAPAPDSQVAHYCAHVKPHSGNTPSFAADSAWQETDDLTDKTLPFYSFVVDLAISAGLAYDQKVIRPNVKSTGAIVRDCAICYCTGSHCGFHAIPLQLDTHSEDDIVMPTFMDMTAGVRAVLDAVSAASATKDQYFRAVVV